MKISYNEDVERSLKSYQRGVQNTSKQQPNRPSSTCTVVVGYRALYAEWRATVKIENETVKQGGSNKIIEGICK